MAIKKSLEWSVYIIQTESGKLYTGITKDLTKRFNQHQKKQKGANFFHFSPPKEVVFTEDHPNRSEASKREAAIKKMNRKEKVSLISSAKKDLGSKSYE